MEEKRSEQIWKEFCKIFWVFMLGCFLGFVYETILVLFQKGFFESRQGIVYGPLIPVYGIGGVIYYLVFRIWKPKDNIEVFLMSMILGGVTEYICSFVQEVAFGTISWDYSYLTFNLNGRTSLLHCVYWGIAGLLYTNFIKPQILKIDRISSLKWVKVVTIITTILMVINIGISCLAAGRQAQRVKQIPAGSKIDEFFDRFYPDPYMNRILSNKKQAKG